MRKKFFEVKLGNYKIVDKGLCVFIEVEVIKIFGILWIIFFLKFV